MRAAILLSLLLNLPSLDRISHQVSTAAADSGMSTALRSVGLLDVLSSTPAEPSGRAPCIHARLRRLATKPGEKSGLAPQGIADAIGLYERGKFQAAADALSGLRRQDPNNANVHLWLGKTYYRLHRWDNAIEEFEKTIALDPKNGTYHLWLGRACGNKAAHALLPIGLAKRTLQEFEAAVRLSPDDLDARFDLLDYYAEAWGIVGGDRKKAEEQAREIARRSTRQGYTARAEIHEDNKEWDRARQELAEATTQFPNDSQGFQDYAAFLLERRDYEHAEAAARRAVALEGSAPKARMLLAAAQVELRKEVPGASAVLQQLSAGPLSDQDPSFEEVYYWLGRAYLTQGQKVEARKAFETALSFDSDYAKAKDALGQIRHVP